MNNLFVVRFDDSVARKNRNVRTTDRLSYVREFVEKLRHNFKRVYIPPMYITVDERMVRFRGRCIFKIYMKSKPARYGLKIWSICSQNGYLLDFDLYTGKQNLKVCQFVHNPLKFCILIVLQEKLMENRSTIRVIE